MHHGEFEMRRRIIDRNARVLGDRDHDERNQRQAQRNAQPHFVRGHEGRDDRELGRAREQREREHDHQHGGLGERGDHHLARGADAAEARADVEAGERLKEARAAQERDDGDEIGRPAEQKAARESRDKRRRQPGRCEDDIGHGAEEPRCVLGEHGFLAEQANQFAIRLPQRRSAPAHEARFHLAHEPGEQRREREHQHHLRGLNGEIVDQGHSASTRSKRTRARNTRLR